MMKVELLNKQDFLNDGLFEKWGNSALVCYNSPKEDAIKIGKACLNSGHYSGSRGIYFMFKFTNVARSCIDQAIRHDVGIFKNVQSFRYVNKSGFSYYTSDVINSIPEAKKIYDETMDIVANNYSRLVNVLEDNGITGEVANQSARGIIPMNTNAEFVMGFTVEALINFANKRLCTRAEEHIRKLAKLIVKEVLGVVPELESKLVPQCGALLYCPEGFIGRNCPLRTSGKVLTKKQLQDKL